MRQKMKNKRNKLLITPNLQLKFVFITVLAAWIPIFILSIEILRRLNDILNAAKNADVVIQQNILASVTVISTVLFIAVPLFTILLVYLMYVLTNRIVGPIYRLETDLDEILTGRGSRVIQFRKNDAFQTLAVKVNMLLDKLPKEEKKD